MEGREGDHERQREIKLGRERKRVNEGNIEWEKRVERKGQENGLKCWDENNLKQNKCNNFASKCQDNMAKLEETLITKLNGTLIKRLIIKMKIK